MKTILWLGFPHNTKNCINVAALGRSKTTAVQRLLLPPLNLKGFNKSYGQVEQAVGRAGPLSWALQEVEAAQGGSLGGPNSIPIGHRPQTRSDLAGQTQPGPGRPGRRREVGELKEEPGGLNSL